MICITLLLIGSAIFLNTYYDITSRQRQGGYSGNSNSRYSNIIRNWEDFERYPWPRAAFDVLNHVVLLLAGLACLVPLIHIVAVSFSSNAASIGRLVGLWPVGFNLFNYEWVLRWPQFRVSFLIRLDLLPVLSRLVEEITGLPNGYFKPIVGRGAFNYEQWGGTAALIAGGARPYAFPFEPEIIGRSPRLMIGKWSDTGAVAQKLAEYGLSAPPDRLDTILLRSQMASVARHRPLKDDEFLVIAQAEGALPSE